MSTQHAGGEPVFLLPKSVTWLAIVLIAIEVIRQFVLTREGDAFVILTFAFIPARYLAGALGGASLPGGILADGWTFLTYAFLHGGVAHLVVNVLWMLAFGTALARRFGTGRFLAFSALGAVAGALAHLAFHFGEPVPLVGASAAISAQMAGAARFVFDRGAPLGIFRQAGPEGYFRPALPLSAVLTNARALAFLGIWFAINLLIGITSAAGVASQVIAWEAHIGGFLFGLVAFPFFDPVRPSVRRG